MDLYLNIAKGESITHFLHLGANVNFTNDQCIQWNDQMHVGIFEPPGTNLQRTPLHAAVITNHLHTVTELLSHNANVDAKDTRQLTPLLLAANLTSRYPEFITTRLSIIHLLLHYNANPHLKGYMGHNLLTTALFSKFYALVPIALQIPNMDLNCPSLDGTPLELAIRDPMSRKYVNTLLSMGASPRLEFKNVENMFMSPLENVVKEKLQESIHFIRHFSSYCGWIPFLVFNRQPNPFTCHPLYTRDVLRSILKLSLIIEK